MDDPESYLELFRTIHAEVDALVYPTYPNGETVDRYKHVKALMEDPASGLEIAPIIAGSADLTPPLDYARSAPNGDWLLHMPLSDLFYQLELARELRAAAVHGAGEVLEEDAVLREGERAAELGEHDGGALQLEPRVLEPPRADEDRLVRGARDVRLHGELPVRPPEVRDHPREQPEIERPRRGEIELGQ